MTVSTSEGTRFPSATSIEREPEHFAHAACVRRNKDAPAPPSGSSAVFAVGLPVSPLIMIVVPSQRSALGRITTVIVVSAPATELDSKILLVVKVACVKDRSTVAPVSGTGGTANATLFVGHVPFTEIDACVAPTWLLKLIVGISMSVRVRDDCAVDDLLAGWV